MPRRCIRLTIQLLYLGRHLQPVPRKGVRGIHKLLGDILTFQFLTQSLSSSVKCCCLKGCYILLYFTLNFTNLNTVPDPKRQCWKFFFPFFHEDDILNVKIFYFRTVHRCNRAVLFNVPDVAWDTGLYFSSLLCSSRLG